MAISADEAGDPRQEDPGGDEVRARAGRPRRGGSVGRARSPGARHRRAATGLLDGLAERLHLVDHRSTSSPRPPSSATSSACTDSSMVRAAASSRRALRRRSRLSASPITRSSRSTVASWARSDSIVRSIVEPVAQGWSALASVAAISRRMASGSTRRRASTRSWPRRAIRHTSSTPGVDPPLDLAQAVAHRPLAARTRRPRGTGLRACSASVTKRRQGSDEREGIDPGIGRGAGDGGGHPAGPGEDARAPRRRRSRRRRGCRGWRRRPRARMPSGEVVARATGGVKNRSRKDSPLAMSAAKR